MNQLFSEPVSYYNHFASDVRLSIRPSVHPSVRPSVHPSIRLSTIMCARQFLRNYLVDFNDTWYNPCMIGGVDARSLIFEIGPFSATRSRVKRSEIHFLLNISLKCQIGTYIVLQTYRKSLWPFILHVDLWPWSKGQRSKFRHALFAQYLLKMPNRVLHWVTNI